LEEELKKYGFSMDSPRKLVSVLLKINQVGYDPLKIVSFVARIKSASDRKGIEKELFSIRIARRSVEGSITNV
jgi:hypothetical protein